MRAWTKDDGFRTLFAGAFLLVVAATAASPLAAQEDARWLPWVGCWEAMGEAGAGEMLCIRPAIDGVEFLTVDGEEVVSTETLPSDGRLHAVEREGCVGSQSARFSSDRGRVFITSEMTCEGEFQRETTGLMAMTSPSTWIDVQAVEAGGRDVAWVRHYRLAPRARVEATGLSAMTSGRGMAVSTARYQASAAVSLDDVMEAREHVHPEAVKAWVAELNDPFDLDGETLVELADAGLEPEIIDVMVAVTWPEHFRLDRDAAEADRYVDDYDRWPNRGYGPRYGYWGSRMYYDPFYSRYGYGSYGYYGYYGPSVIVVSPSDGARSTGGRMVKGRGYTRPGSTPSVRSGGGSSGSVGSGSATKERTPTGRKAKPKGGGSGGDEGGGGSF